MNHCFKQKSDEKIAKFEYSYILQFSGIVI
nr:MAG TPA: hypothetical protein [Bacteriophage sp.]